MKKVLIFSVAILLNTLILFNLIAPRYVTWADTIPKEVICSNCTSPEVKHALAQAIVYGRSQAFDLTKQNSTFIIVLLNIILVGALLFIPGLSKPSETKYQKRS